MDYTEQRINKLCFESDEDYLRDCHILSQSDTTKSISDNLMMPVINSEISNKCLKKINECEYKDDKINCRKRLLTDLSDRKISLKKPKIKLEQQISKKSLETLYGEKRFIKNSWDRVKELKCKGKGLVINQDGGEKRFLKNISSKNLYKLETKIDKKKLKNKVRKNNICTLPKLDLEIDVSRISKPEYNVSSAGISIRCWDSKKSKIDKYESSDIKEINLSKNLLTKDKESLRISLCTKSKEYKTFSDESEIDNIKNEIMSEIKPKICKNIKSVQSLEPVKYSINILQRIKVEDIDSDDIYDTQNILFSEIHPNINFMDKYMINKKSSKDNEFPNKIYRRKINYNEDYEVCNEIKRNKIDSFRDNFEIIKPREFNLVKVDRKLKRINARKKKLEFSDEGQGTKKSRKIILSNEQIKLLEHEFDKRNIKHTQANVRKLAKELGLPNNRCIEHMANRSKIGLEVFSQRLVQLYQDVADIRENISNVWRKFEDGWRKYKF